MEQSGEKLVGHERRKMKKKKGPLGFEFKLFVWYQ